MSESAPPPDEVKIGNLVLVIVILTLFHLSLTYMTIKAKVVSDAILEFERVEKAILGASKDPAAAEEARKESQKQGWFEAALNLPIVYFLDRNPKGNWYHSLEVPKTTRLLNSIAAAMIMQLVGMLATQLCPEENRWRKFFEGRGIHKKGGLPKELDRVPLFSAARKLEKVEKTRFGTAAVLAFFHFFLAGAATMCFVGSRLNSGGPSWPAPLFYITHFPITPLLLSAADWAALSSRAFIVLAVANSALFGLGAQAILERVRRPLKR